MQACNDEIDIRSPCRGEIGGHPHGVDPIDDHALRHRQAVGAVGIVHKSQAQAAAAEKKRMVPSVIGAVGENPRMPYAAAVEFGNARADAFGAAVAAMVVGQHGHIDTRLAQRVGQRHRRPEHRITRIAATARKGGFEVDDCEIRRPDAGNECFENRPVVESVAAAGRFDLRQVLHHVAAEQQAHPLRRRHAARSRPLCRTAGLPLHGPSGRGAADRGEQHGCQDMYPADSHDNCGAKLR